MIRAKQFVLALVLAFYAVLESQYMYLKWLFGFAAPFKTTVVHSGSAFNSLVLEKCSTLLNFKPVVWGQGSLFQLFLAVACPAPQVKYFRENLAMEDRGTVALDWASDPEDNPEAPTLLILHGVAGHSQERYVRRMVSLMTAHGWHCVVYNRRGHGVSKALAKTASQVLRTLPKLPGSGDASPAPGAAPVSPADVALQGRLLSRSPSTDFVDDGAVAAKRSPSEETALGGTSWLRSARPSMARDGNSHTDAGSAGATQPVGSGSAGMNVNDVTTDAAAPAGRMGPEAGQGEDQRAATAAEGAELSPGAAAADASRAEGQPVAETTAGEPLTAAAVLREPSPAYPGLSDREVEAQLAAAAVRTPAVVQRGDDLVVEPTSATAEEEASAQQPGTTAEAQSTAGWPKLWALHCDVCDMVEVVAQIGRRRPKTSGIYAIGFSAGSNCLIKYVGDLGRRCPLAAAVSVANGYDLEHGMQYIEKRAPMMQRMITLNLLKMFKASERDIEAHAPKQILRKDLRAVKTVRQLDQAVTAKLYGLKSVESYYRHSSCITVMNRVAVPLLCLNSLDDPLIDKEFSRLGDTFAEKNPNIISVLTSHGGHLGWVTAWRKQWTSTAISEFLLAAHSVRLRQCTTGREPDQSNFTEGRKSPAPVPDGR